jgi:hypothetical protein
VVLAALFYWKAEQNYHHQDYVNSNFFSFWLSGHMVWTGESPYDESQWMAGFDAAGASYRPSKILQYPLPLMFFMAPVGALPVGQAYFVWQLVCQMAIALTVHILLRHEPAGRILILPIVAFLLFFGPVYLSLQVGSVGAISLLGLTLAILFLETERPLLAGLALSLTLLKPPQALTVLLLAGIWFLARRQWKVIGGVLLGGLCLLAIWLARDPLGLAKFRGSSDFLLGHTLGVQSNVYSLAYLACDRSLNCMWVAGSAAASLILMLGTFVLWRNRLAWTDWQAFDVIIPVGFVSAIYLWSYDQLLYVIPIVWIVTRLFTTSRPYISVFVFLVIIDVISFAALAVQAYTKLDLLSIVTTLFVLGLCAWLLQRGFTSGSSSPAPASGTSL